MPTTERSDSLSPPIPIAKPRILVVDDERIIATTSAIILQAHGFEVATAFTGLTAIESARSFVPDCLLSDVAMPDLNGVDAAIEIQRMFPKCKIFLISGQATTTDLLGRARAQGYDFPLLVKPVHPTALLQQLAEATGMASRLRKSVILVVDDDDAQRYAVSHILRYSGCEVIEAGTGTQALTLATEKQPDLILLDLKLPDISGYEVCKRLKAAPGTKQIPVVHLTAAYRTEDSKVASVESGAEQFLMHPISGEELVSALSSFLGSTPSRPRP